MPQGNYPSFDPRNPTLLPQFDPPSVGGQSQVGGMSPAQFIAANPRTASTATITVGGTITNNDTVAIKFACGVLPGGVSPSGSYTVAAVTIVTGDTTATVANKVARAINDDLTLRAYGIFADVSAAGVITVSWPGPVGNFCTLTATVTGGATETFTFSNTGKLTGGAGYVVPVQNFEFATGTAVFALWANIPATLGYDVITNMVNQGQPIS